MYKDLTKEEKAKLEEYSKEWNSNHFARLTPTRFYNRIVKRINCNNYDREEVKQIYFNNVEISLIDRLVDLANIDKSIKQTREHDKHIAAVIDNMGREEITWYDAQKYLLDKFRALKTYGIYPRLCRTKITFHAENESKQYYTNRVFWTSKITKTANAKTVQFRGGHLCNSTYYKDEIEAIMPDFSQSENEWWYDRYK